MDARLIAATNRNLEEEVRQGRFREDLFYRLSVVRIALPPLRERREDIPILIRHFLRQAPFNRGPDGEPRVKGLSEAAMMVLLEYHWPGNVRELINVVERSTSFADGDLIEADDLPPHILGATRKGARGDGGRTEPIAAAIRMGKTFKEAKEAWIERFEKEYLAALLRKHQHSLSAASREADIDRKHLRKLVRKYGLVTEDKDTDK